MSSPCRRRGSIKVTLEVCLALRDVTAPSSSCWVSHCKACHSLQPLFLLRTFFSVPHVYPEECRRGKLRLREENVSQGHTARCPRPGPSPRPTPPGSPPSQRAVARGPLPIPPPSPPGGEQFCRSPYITHSTRLPCINKWGTKGS